MTREDHILAEISTLNKEVGKLSGQLDSGFRAIEETQKEFRAQLVDLFRMHRECPGPHVADAVTALREEFAAHRDLTTTTKIKRDSDDKISRPPKAPRISDRTLQLLIVLAIVVLGGGGLIAQLVLQ